jgi:hypothetical protein
MTNKPPQDRGALTKLIADGTLDKQGQIIVSLLLQLLLQVDDLQKQLDDIKAQLKTRIKLSSGTQYERMMERLFGKEGVKGR